MRFSEPTVTRMQEMISLLVEGLTPYLDRPYALYGHSIGALTAFELARGVSSARTAFPRVVFRVWRRRRPAVSHLARPEFIKAMRDHFEVAPALLDDTEMMAFVFPDLRADYELVETYAYQEEPPFGFPFSVFGGSHDPEAIEEELLAWQKHTTGLFRMTTLEGNHMFINTSREALVRELPKDLRFLTR
jgi:surfactin synthase thioesterase subunit